MKKKARTRSARSEETPRDEEAPQVEEVPPAEEVPPPAEDVIPNEVTQAEELTGTEEMAAAGLCVTVTHSERGRQGGPGAELERSGHESSGRVSRSVGFSAVSVEPACAWNLCPHTFACGQVLGTCWDLSVARVRASPLGQTVCV